MKGLVHTPDVTRELAEADHCDDGRADDQRRPDACALLAEEADAHHQGQGPDAERRHADDVERTTVVGAALLVARDVSQTQHHQQDADRNVHEEDAPPRPVRNT